MLRRRLRVKRYEDLFSGVLFTVLGIGALIVALSYPMGTATRMGPGYLPMILSGLLTLLGLAIILGSLSLAPPAPDGPEGELPAFLVGFSGVLRPMIFISAALVSFSVLLPRLGLVIAVIVLVIISSFAEPRLRPFTVAALALALATVSVLIFSRGLGLPIPIWP